MAKEAEAGNKQQEKAHFEIPDNQPQRSKLRINHAPKTADHENQLLQVVDNQQQLSECKEKAAQTKIS